MILPLAWLYRVEPTEEHLDWLHFMTNELLRNQVPCGGIREELGDESKSLFGRTPSNAEYGNNEAPLIFDNGDPSNADAGWGVWSPLTGWIQSWIVGTQFVLEEDSSLWDIANQKDVSTVATKVIEEMITRQL